MSKEFPQWKQKSHYGGFSDDRFLGVANSFRYAKAVEIRKNPQSLTLAYAAEKNSGTIVTDLCNKIMTVSTTGDVIAFGNTGKIYRKAYGAGTWVNVYTQTSNLAIINAFEYNAYLYWFTSGLVNRIALSAIDDSWAGTVTESYKTFSNGNANSHPAIELNNKLYIGDGYYLAELDSVGTFTGNKLSIFHDEEIRSLTYGGAYMKIYSRKSTKIEGGHKYFWDGTSEAYNERVYTGNVIHCAISNGGDDWVIAGRKPFIYNSTGYTWDPKKRLPLVYDTENCYISPNAIDYYDGLVVIGLAESGTASIGRGVWTWGQEDYKYPMSLNFDYPTSNDNITDNVGAVHNSNGTLYFSWKKTTPGTPDTYTYGIDMVNTSKYAATGSLHSRVHYGEEADETKGAMFSKLAFDILSAGEKIELYMRKNLASSWESTPEISADYTYTPDTGTTYPDRGVNDKREDDTQDIGDYNFLETKIVLTAGTSQATTPEVIEISVGFDPDVEVGDQ